MATGKIYIKRASIAYEDEIPQNGNRSIIGFGDGGPNTIKYFIPIADIIETLIDAGDVTLTPIVAVSSDDTTADYLENLLVAGTGVTLTVNNPGADETITIDGTTYAVSAETDASGAIIRLTDSAATTDDILLNEGTGITITRDDASTITIASTASATPFDWFDAGNGVFVYADGTNTTSSLSVGSLTIDGNGDAIRTFKFVGDSGDLSAGEFTVNIDNNGANDGTSYNTSDADSIWPSITVQNRNVVLPTDPYKQQPYDATGSIDIFNERFSLAGRVTVKLTGLSGDFGLKGNY